MIIDAEKTMQCASLLDATDSHVQFAMNKLKATEQKDLGDLTATMDAARDRVTGSLGTVHAVQQEISGLIRTCTTAIVSQDRRSAENLSDAKIPFPVLR